MSGYAQNSLVATLQHGTSIQAYYGEDALSEAHTAAVDGDIITLSTGDFNSCDITKAITVRGEGIGKTKLKLSNNITFTVPQSSTHTLSLEGLDFLENGSAKPTINGVDGTERVILSKCCFRYSLDINNCNASIVQCLVYDRLTTTGQTNATCLNSKFGYLSLYDNSHFDIQNCIVASATDFKNSSIKNSIIHTSGWALDASNTSSHCLVLGSTNSGFANSWYLDDFSNVIVGNPIYDNDKKYSFYQLTEDAATTYLGTDSTPVGIYGGMYPYNETPSYPLVKKLDVIGTHSNGKLNVKINVE